MRNWLNKVAASPVKITLFVIGATLVLFIAERFGFRIP